LVVGSPRNADTRQGKPSEPNPFSLAPDFPQPHRSNHGLITDFNIGLTRRLCIEVGPLLQSGRLSRVSYLKLDSYFHNLRAWNFEICTRPLSVVMHEGE
jgi:hypothetical protein